MKTPHEVYIEALQKISKDMAGVEATLRELAEELDKKRALLEKLKQVYNET